MIPVPGSSGAARKIKNQESRIKNQESTSAYLDQPELLLPSCLHEFQQLACEAALVDETTGLAVRRFHEIAIAHEVARAELWQPRLTRTEKIARAAQLEVLLGNHEPVVRVRHGLQSLARIIGPWRLIQQDAM